MSIDVSLVILRVILEKSENSMVSTRRRKSGDRRAEKLQKEEYEDAIEANYRKMTGKDDSSEEEEEELSESDEEEVLGLGSDIEGGESDDSELDSEDEMEKGTRYGELLKQARAIKAKLDIARGEDEDDEEESSSEESEEEEREKEGWGARKSAYYDADVIDMEGSDEEEDLQAEEEEATRLQKEAAAQLDDEDYGSLSEDDDDSDDGNDLGKIVDMDELDEDTKDLREAAVRQDALELKALLQELRSSLSEIRGRLGPLLQEIKSGDIATSEGVSYLEAKHLLLLHYVANLIFYLLLKAEGRSVKDHPVIPRLIEIRSFLEKTRPIDKKLKYQIEKLLLAAEAERENPQMIEEEDANLTHKPRPGALVVDDDDKSNHIDKDGTYRPPKLNPVSMELDETDDIGTGRMSSKERRKQINASRKASRSSFIQEFAAELSGAPEEKKMGVPIGMDTSQALRDRQKLAARAEVEEELMIRVPLSKDERKRLKAQRRAGLSGKALLDDFQDDLADIVNGNEELGIDARFSKHKTNQLYGVDQFQNQKNHTSGDADLPERESLVSRRAKMDGIRAKRAISYNVGDDEPVERFETDFYKESKARSERNKKQRQEAMAPDDLLPPMAEPTTSGARKIDSAIEKNRGLTPHRRKDLKNPRKKHRIKFAEANVRRKGQVQTVKSGAASAYGGESTGIKSKVSKSVRF